MLHGMLYLIWPWVLSRLSAECAAWGSQGGDPADGAHGHDALAVGQAAAPHPRLVRLEKQPAAAAGASASLTQAFARTKLLVNRVSG